MDHAFRQFLRSFFISVILFILPVSYLGSEIYLNWILRNYIFLTVWAFLCVAVGYFAHTAGKNKIIYNRFAAAMSQRGVMVQEEKLKKLPLHFRMPLLWSRCSRCMSYSLGGLVSFTAAVFYFNRPVIASGLYFLFLGAAFTSAAALFFYLRDEVILYKKENGKNEYGS